MSEICVPNTNDDTINISALFESDEEGEVDPEVPVCTRKKRGRKSNKPNPFVKLSEPVDLLSKEVLIEDQNQDDDIKFVIKLLKSGAGKPSWTDISGKSAAVKFLIARWDLLSLQEGLGVSNGNMHLMI